MKTDMEYISLSIRSGEELYISIIASSDPIILIVYKNIYIACLLNEINMFKLSIRAHLLPLWYKLATYHRTVEIPQTTPNHRKPPQTTFFCIW